MLFQWIYCIASGAQRLIGPRGNTYLADQRSCVLTVELCGTSYLAYGHLGFWGAVLLCSTDSREVQQPGTNKMIKPAKYANDVDHGEIYNAKAPARGTQSFLWHDMASTIIKTAPVKQKECIPQKPLPPAKPPPAQPRRTRKEQPPK